jgi:hypothetical protein
VAFGTLALVGCFLGPAASAEAEKTPAEVEDTSLIVGETSAEENKTSVELRSIAPTVAVTPLLLQSSVVAWA